MPTLNIRHSFPELLLALALLLSGPPLAAQDDPGDASENDAAGRFTVEIESSSHVVRRENDRLNVRFRGDVWSFEGLVAQPAPLFQESRDQLGLLASRAFGENEITALFRFTDKPGGEDLVGSLLFARPTGAGGAWGVDLTFAQSDLASDFFIAEDDETQLHGRLFWRGGSGFELELFASDKITFDLSRGTAALLRRLPRSEIVGAETLADLYLDEGRLEDSAGARVGWRRDDWQAKVYLKSGEQTLRGFPVGDDFTGFGGELHLDTGRIVLHTEVDLRQVDSADGFDGFDRGRVLVDFRHRPGRIEWGLGGYVQGESESFDEIPDVFDTAGLGATFAWSLRSGRKLGLWAMSEEDAPDSERIARLAFFTARPSGAGAERRWGLGVRRDEIGEARFVDETFGPFFFAEGQFGRLILNGDVGVQDGDAYGRITFGFRP